MSKHRNRCSKRLRKVYERDGGLCWICGHLVVIDEQNQNNPERATLDHVLPRAAGGTLEQENVRIAHAICNQMRGRNYESGAVRWAA